jgi:hypothetical protein
MRDWEEADNKKLPFFSEDPKLCRRTTDTFVRPLFFFLRTWCSCVFFLLACLRASRTSPRASLFCRSQFNHLPLKAKSASKQILEEDRRNGQRKGKKNRLWSLDLELVPGEMTKARVCLWVCVEELFFDGGSSTWKMTSWRGGYLRGVDLGEAPMKKKGIRSLFG